MDRIIELRYKYGAVNIKESLRSNGHPSSDEIVVKEFRGPGFSALSSPEVIANEIGNYDTCILRFKGRFPEWERGMISSKVAEKIIQKRAADIQDEC